MFLEQTFYEFKYTTLFDKTLHAKYITLFDKTLYSKTLQSIAVYFYLLK